MRLRQPRRLQCELLESRLAPAFVTFRAGDGFSAVDDTFIAANLPTTPQTAATQLDVSGAMTPLGARQSLLRFNNIFGFSSNLIPTNATIKAATISLWALSANDVSVPIEFYQVMSGWSASTATWDFFNNGLQTDNVELAASPTVVQPMSGHGYQISSQLIVDSLKSWQSGTPNQGFALLPSTGRTQWSFASSEDPIPDHRPMLTVEYSVPGVENPSYAELAGQPPSPLKAAWFDWADDLRQRRLDRVPSERSNTYYFAQNGDDLTGDGTIDHPWKTLAKAQGVLNAGSIDVRLRFRRGDVWRETTALQVYSDGVTVDDYGNVALAKPLFTRFQLIASNSWVSLHDGVYKATGVASVGWVREAANGFYRLYYRGSSPQDVAGHLYSWWYDADGNNPSSNGQPTLYVNVGGNPADMPGGLEYCPGDGVGWSVHTDNVRMQNLRIEGVGMAEDGLGYGLSVGHQNKYWEFVGQGLEIYFTGYHSFGQIGQYQGTNSVVTLVDCKAGYCTNRFGLGYQGSGDVTVFVSYADYGGNEYYQYDCEAVSGALPSSDWAPYAGLRHGEALYTHSATGDPMNLMLLWKTKTGDAGNPVAWVNVIDNGPPATDLVSARTYIVEDEPGPIYSFWQKPGVVSINNIIDQMTVPAPFTPYFTTLYNAQFPTFGWLINCTVKVDAQNQFFNFYEFVYSIFDQTTYINCHIDIANCPVPVYFRNPFLDPTGTAWGMTLTNCIISLQSASTTGVGAVNDSNHLVHNAYYLPNLSSDPVQHVDGDSGAVYLSQRYAAGTAPSPASPLYDGGAATGLEYDQQRHLRGDRKAIGPLAGAPLPAPTQVKIVSGPYSTVLSNNTVVPYSRTTAVSLTFDHDVDLIQGSLRLWGENGLVPWSIFVIDPPNHGAEWSLWAPLPRGHYVLELDNQPIKIFRVLPGDFDGDGIVSGVDFGIFRQHFNTIDAIGDMNADGFVDAIDFSLFRQFFGLTV